MNQTIEIPEESIALVIGKGGSGLLRIARETKAKVNVPREKTASGGRQLVVTGTQEQFLLVQALVQQLLTETMATATRQGTKRNREDQQPQPLMLPSGQMMELPGLQPSDAMQPQIQLQSVQPQIPLQQMQTQMPLQKMQTQMPLQQMQTRMQTQLMQPQMHPMEMQPQMQLQELQPMRQWRPPSLPCLVPIPSAPPPALPSFRDHTSQKLICRLLINDDQCGAIIGKRGSGLKALMVLSGATSSIDRNETIGKSRLMTVEGGIDALQVAVSTICERLKDAAVPSAKSSCGLGMLFPAEKGGIVVGKGGTGLHKLSSECGVQLEAQRELVGSERVLYISGSPAGVSAAVCTVMTQLARERY